LHKAPASAPGNPFGFSISGQAYVEQPAPLAAAYLTTWWLRRLQLACAIARGLRLAANCVRV